ncbi:MAG TPA: sensor histidine kinase [Marmoricola sp.]
MTLRRAASSASSPPGCRHDAGIFSSTSDLLATVVPFLDEAAEFGIPAVVRLGADLAAVVRERVSSPECAVFVEGGDVANPVLATRTMTESVAQHLRGGAGQVRVVACVPRPSQSSAEGWEPWARMEAALNRTFAQLPVWGICCYAAPPAGVVADIHATHTGVLRAGGWQPSREYVEPELFMAGRALLPVEELAETPPSLAMIDPHPGLAREGVRRLTERAGFGTGQADDLVLAVNEILSNGFVHGIAPVLLCGWVTDGEVLFTVRDAGGGITNPFTGMTAPDKDHDRMGGHGLWLARVCADLVGFASAPDGFTVRLTARAR